MGAASLAAGANQHQGFQCGRSFWQAHLRHYVVERAQTRIRVLLNIAAQGLIAGLDPLHIGELEDLRYCDPELAAKTVSENRDLIVGLKVRLGRTHTGPGTNDIEDI